MALSSFQTLTNAMSGSAGQVALPQVANDVLAACNAVMTDLPPGTLPANVIAAVTAGEIAARAVLTVVEQQAPPPEQSRAAPRCEARAAGPHGQPASVRDHRKGVALVSIRSGAEASAAPADLTKPRGTTSPQNGMENWHGYPG